MRENLLNKNDEETTKPHRHRGSPSIPAGRQGGAFAHPLYQGEKNENKKRI